MSRTLVIPEPHISCTNINGRQDYVGEIKNYMNEVLTAVIDETDITNVMFVGDIFNKGFKDIDEYMYWVDWFNNLNNILTSRNGKVYSVVGNHELSFSRNNPFWRLTSLEDNGFKTNFNWSNKAVQPKGNKSIISVCDVVDVSDKVTVFLCHYEAIQYCKNVVEEHIKQYGGSKQRICLCHNSIISSTIANVLKKNYGRDPLTHYIKHENIESLDFFHLFDVVYNGHMHKAFSNFTLTNEENGKETRLFYLGSLGRTNSEEVNDADLVRMIPWFNNETGEYGGYKLDLWDRGSTLVSGYDFNKIEEKATKEEYENICRTLIDVENPIKSLMTSLMDRDMLIALECAVDGRKPQELERLLKLSDEV